MPNVPQVDAATVAQLAVKLGLVNDAQMQECKEEVGKLGADPSPLLRVLERKGYLTPFQSQKLAKGDKDGYLLGGFRLLYKISAGTFGRVFRGDDPNTGQIVAIKVLRRRHGESQHHIELFEREGKMGMSLRHQNIVNILAVGRDPATKQHYIVMEFVEGGTLREILQIRKKLEPKEALKLLEDVTSGLAYAFSRGMTHRDMKLTNILVSAQGTAKLVDFGLAGINAGQDDGQVDRTVDYAGLEKASGVKSGDVRSDIYFLGCVFYEMLTSRSPLVMTKDKNARMQSTRFENIPPIRPEEINAPPAVFQSIVHLVERMMSLSPQERFQTPAQLLEAIQEVRREVEGGPSPGARDGAAAPPKEPSIFVVEKNAQLQNTLREKFKELGYRVLMSIDPGTALNRFKQQPFDALLVDAGTVGEEGLTAFQQIVTEAERRRRQCAAILLLGEKQADWAEKIPKNPKAVALVRPLTLGAVYRKLRELNPPKE